jgi:DNA-directed RNA polymerase subunit RPC12/RpoP
MVALAVESATSRLPRADVLAAALIWCRFAEGKLSVGIRGKTAEIRFADWARTLAPPPYHCPYTGVDTYRIVATDDGRIVAGEMVAPCAETGRRMLSGELVECSATGKRVVASLTATCPVTDRPVLKSALVRCATCGEEVSPTVVEHGRCAACRHCRSVRKADPRMARVLDEHPGLESWRSWRISETSRAYILTASGLWRRLLLVFDKETLRPIRVAQGNRALAGWSLLRPDQFDEVLKRGSSS